MVDASKIERLNLNIELSSPDQFLPLPHDWQQHSRFVARHGQVEFFHYDFRAQALAKISRGHERDLADVRSMIARGLVKPAELPSLAQEISPELIRYPAIDAHAFEARVERFLGDEEAG